MIRYAIICLAAITVIFASCKKDTGQGSLQVRTQITGQSSYQPNVEVKLYATSATSWIVDSTFTNNEGLVDFGKIDAMSYTILATWEDTLPNGDINHYEADTTVVVGKDEDVLIDMVLPCTCCPTFSCVNGNLDKRNCWCACPEGYHGTICDTLSRAALLGAYTTTDPCESAPYTITIGPANTLGGIMLSNLGNLQLGGQIIAIRANMSATKFNIPQQSFNSGNITIMGSGSMHGDSITIFTYWKKTVNNVENNESCKMTLVKQ